MILSMNYELIFSEPFSPLLRSKGTTLKIEKG